MSSSHVSPCADVGRQCRARPRRVMTGESQPRSRQPGRTSSRPGWLTSRAASRGQYGASSARSEPNRGCIWGLCKLLAPPNGGSTAGLTSAGQGGRPPGQRRRVDYTQLHSSPREPARRQSKRQLSDQAVDCTRLRSATSPTLTRPTLGYTHLPPPRLHHLGSATPTYIYRRHSATATGRLQ